MHSLEYLSNNMHIAFLSASYFIKIMGQILFLVDFAQIKHFQRKIYLYTYLKEKLTGIHLHPKLQIL